MARETIGSVTVYDAGFELGNVVGVEIQCEGDGIQPCGYTDSASSKDEALRKVSRGHLVDHANHKLSFTVKRESSPPKIVLPMVGGGDYPRS